MTHVYFNLIPKFQKSAGTAKEFHDWDAKMREEYPVRYAINETIDNVVKKCWVWPLWRLRDMKRALSYRVDPAHRYNTIVIGEPGYYEPFQRILRAPFVVFVEFMDIIYAGNSFVQWQFDENDKLDANLTQEYIDEKNALWTEMETLYKWWTEERPTRREALDETYPLPTIPKEWGVMAMLNEDYRNTPEVAALRECYDARSKVESQWDEEDYEMLCRLAKIRLHLWD